MARVKTELFQINGKPMFAPDADIDFSYDDLDDADSGRSVRFACVRYSL